LHVDALQISKLADEALVREKYKIAENIAMVKFSDAHFPADIGKTYTDFVIKEPSFEEIRKALQRIDGRMVKIP